MSEIDEFELSQEHRAILSNAIVKYLNEEVGLSDLEECISDLSRDAGASSLIADIYHLLQHFDADDGAASKEESRAMSRKVRNIANLLLVGDVNTMKKSINYFFSDPYGL